MLKYQLEIVALSHSVSNNQTYAIVLGEVNGIRKIPIIIGPFEAQAIMVAIEKVQPSRPLTHDLLKNVILEMGVLEEVIIYKLSEGIFYSKLYISTADGIVELDSRTSDAIALAVRFNCPIYTFNEILDSAGGNFAESKDQMPELNAIMDEINNPNKLSLLTIDELEEKLEEALAAEDYKEAAKLRDEINLRQNNS